MSRAASRVGWVAILALAVVSCQTPETSSLGKPLDLRVAGAIEFQDSDLDLRFRRVLSDSRCPRGVQCITAGEAVVVLEGRIMKGASETFEVRLDGGETQDSTNGTAYDGYQIRLIKLEPYPVAGAVVDTSTYVGTFVVEKR